MNVLADGSLVVDRQTIEMDRFMRMIEVEIQRVGSADSLDLVLRADQSISTQRLNELARTLMDRGVRTWRLATDPSGGSS